MKVAVLVCKLNGIGGEAKYALYVARELIAMGHQVTVWSVEYDEDECYPELAEGLDIQTLRPAGLTTAKDTQRPSGARMLAYMWSLVQSFKDQRRLSLAIPGGYDIVNAHGNEIIWAAVQYKRRHGTPVVWMCNDFWPVASQRYEVVSNGWERIKHVAKVALSFPFDQYDQAAVRDMDGIVVLSEQVKSQMRDHYGANSIIVRTGVDSLRFASGDGQQARARHLLRDSTFVLLTLCTLMPRRRIEDVVRAVRILVDEGLDITYLVVGRTSHSPDYAQYVQAEVAACNLDDHVIFVGEVAEEELVDYYHACDAFVWAADETQSWGMAGLEAMAAGKPVIVSRANGLAEALEDGKTALLVPARSPGAIADAVKGLMGDPTLANSVANQGRRLVCERYSWRRNAEAMLDLFREAIGLQ